MSLWCYWKLGSSVSSWFVLVLHLPGFLTHALTIMQAMSIVWHRYGGHESQLYCIKRSPPRPFRFVTQNYGMERLGARLVVTNISPSIPPHTGGNDGMANSSWQPCSQPWTHICKLPLPPVGPTGDFLCCGWHCGSQYSAVVCEQT